MQHHAAHELNIEGNHVPNQVVTAHFARRATQPAAGVFHGREGLAHDAIQRFAGSDPVLEFLRLGLKLVFGKHLIRLFQFVDPVHQRLKPLYIPVIFRPKKRFD